MAYKLTYEELELELARVQVLADHRCVRLAAATELLGRVTHWVSETLMRDIEAFLANAPAAPTLKFKAVPTERGTDYYESPAPTRTDHERAVLEACAVLGDATLRLVQGRMRGVAKAELARREATK